jgi:hypothetical protein
VDGHQAASYEASTRIVSMILGELPREQFFADQKNFML